MSLTASEIDCAVVVEKIPLAEQQQTEDALMVNFSTYGQITKMTLQQAQETQTQTAVIVYATEEASVEASAFDSEILGGKVTVTRPSSVILASPKEQKWFQTVSSGTAVVLAESYLISKMGVSALQHLEEQVGIMDAVKRIDEANHISSTVLEAGDKIGSTIGTEISKINERFKITEAVKSTTDMALENEYVSTGVKIAGNLVSSVWDWTKKTVDTAKHIVEEKSGEETAEGEGANSQATSEAPASSNEESAAKPQIV